MTRRDAPLTEMAFETEVGRLVELERMERGWSVRFAAEKAGVSYWGWRNAELGRGCSLGTLHRLADALNLDVFIDLESR